MSGRGEPLGSKYLLEEEIGRGGMGIVWCGRERESGKVYAIKVIRPELARDTKVVGRFVQERTALTQVRHHNIVAVHDMIVEGDRLALVMDLVAGSDLVHHRESRGGTLPPAEAAWLAAQICDGLAAAHALGIVHRDVKPANVLVDHADPASPVRLADFGIARIAEVTRLTSTDVVIGTASYLAPEVIMGHPPQAAADVYAVGMTLHELLVGRGPFPSGPPATVLHHHLNARPSRLPGIPDALWPLIDTCLTKDPAARPSAAALAAALRAAAPALADLPPAPALDPTTPPAFSPTPGSFADAFPPPHPTAIAFTPSTSDPGHPGFNPNGEAGGPGTGQPAFSTGGPGQAGLNPSDVAGGPGGGRSAFGGAGGGGFGGGALGATVGDGAAFRTLPHSRQGGGRKRAVAVGAVVAAVVAVAGVGVGTAVLAAQGGGGGRTGGDAASSAPAVAAGTTGATVGGSAGPNGSAKGRGAPTSKSSATAQASPSPGAGAAASSAAARVGFKKWACGPVKVFGDGRRLQSCYMYDKARLYLKAVLQGTPAGVTSDSLNLVFKRADQSDLGNWDGPACTGGTTCTFVKTLTPAHGTYTVLPKRLIGGNWVKDKSDGREPGLIDFWA